MYDHLIGLALKHHSWGEARITAIVEKPNAVYFRAYFQSLSAEKEMRLDLLTDTPGKYFSDVRDEMEYRRVHARRLAVAPLICERGIHQLVHFTRIENVPSILKSGLLPRSHFEILGSQPLINDELRLDGCLNAVSLSISHPNEDLFYRFRKHHEDSKWAVLAIEPAILWTVPCELHLENAAAKRGGTAVPLRTFRAPDSHEFDLLFQDLPDIPARQLLGHAAHDTTNHQSEVLAFGIIPSDQIRYVAVQERYDLAYLENLLARVEPGNVKLLIERNFFEYRRCTGEFKAARAAISHRWTAGKHLDDIPF